MLLAVDHQWHVQRRGKGTGEAHPLADFDRRRGCLEHAPYVVRDRPRGQKQQQQDDVGHHQTDRRLAGQNGAEQRHVGCGDAGQKTGGDAMKERIGDALRNAGMRFGIALDLWHKDGVLEAGGSIESVEPPPDEMIKRVKDGHEKGASVGEICNKLSLTERQVKNILESNNG